MFNVYADDYRITIDEIPLGNQGEKEARCLIIDATAVVNEFGAGGTLEVSNQRHGDILPYPVTNYAMITSTGEAGETLYYIRWILTDVDTAKAGSGYMQATYKIDTVVCKTWVYKYFILPSQGITGDVPEPYDDIIEKINEAIEAGEIATEAASTATAAAESASGDASTASTAAESAAQSATDAAASAARLDDLYTMHTVTLSVASWSNNVQSATVTGVLADESKQLITVAPSSASEDAYVASGILATVQAADTITFRATVTPTEAITVYIVVANEVSGE